MANERDPAARNALLHAQQLIRDGSLDAADAALARALTSTPDDPNALYLRGVVANRRNDYGAAVALLQKAALMLQSAPVWLALGNAYAGCNEPRIAADVYREVVAREPEWPDAHYNLGLMLKRQDDFGGAARSFLTAWMLDLSQVDSGRQCVAAIEAWVRAGNLPFAMDSVRVDEAQSFTIVVCSIDDTKLERLIARYRQLFAGIDHEIVSIRDARSLAEAYNRAIRQSASDFVLLSHDDVDFLMPDFAARLIQHLRVFDVVGVVGSIKMSGPTPSWSGHPHLRGWVTHHASEDAVWRADVFDPRPVAADAVVLDGVLLAARRAVFDQVPFDEETFDGFHLYDVDWSYRAAQAGFRLAATGDLLLIHESRGKYDHGWQLYAERFCAKHQLRDVARPSQSLFFEATFDTPDQVRAFYCRLSELAADLRIS